MKPNSSFPVVCAFCCVVLFAVTAAPAQDGTAPYGTFWRADPSIIAPWFDMANWSAGVPGAETYAYINNGGTAHIGGDATHAIPAVAGSLHLGGDIGGAIRQDGNMLTVTHNTWLGAIGYGMPLPEIYPGPSGARPGTYLLFNGVFGSSNLYIGSGSPYWLYGAPLVASGSIFRQVGGRSNIGSALHVGYQQYPMIMADPATGDVDAAAMLGVPEPDYLYRPGALYQLSGGVLTAPQAFVGYGGKGRIDQQAGDADIGALHVGGGQSYIYPMPMDPTRPTADSLVVYRWYYDGGMYTLGGGKLNAGSIHVGQRGRGRFTQTGGTATVERSLQVGANWWWYPTLAETDPATGTDPDAAMSSAVMPEYYLPADGTYSLAEGELITTDTEIGIGGMGRFIQSGGVHRVAKTLRVGGNPNWPTLDPRIMTPTVSGAPCYLPEGCFAPWPYPGPASGSYSMSNGSLTAARMELGAGYAGWPINWLDGSTAVSADMWAPIPWHPANFVQTGGEVTVDGDINILGGGYLLANGKLAAGGVHLNNGNAFGPSQFTQTGGIAHIGGEVLLGPQVHTTADDPNAATEMPEFAPYYGPNICTIGGGRLTTDSIRLTGPALATLNVNGGHVNAYGGIRIVGNDAVAHLRGGEISTGVLQVGRLIDYSSSMTPRNRLHVSGKPLVTVNDRLIFGADGGYCAPDGTEILMFGADLENYSTSSPALAGLGNTQLTFSIGPTDDLEWETFEVAGEDLGLTREGFWNNFVLESLVLGGPDVAELRLIDMFDNQPDTDADQSDPEALYVRELIIGPGSRLDLNGLNLYYLCSRIDPDAVVFGGVLDQIDISSWAVPGDSDMDGDVDLDDFVCLKKNFGRRFRVHWGRGDYDSSGCIDLSDFMLMKTAFAGGTAALPEPTTVSLLLLGSALLIRRRK